MGIRVYCGTDFIRYDHEWKQFKELTETTQIEYKNSKEDVHIIGNVYVGGKWLDTIIIKETGIAIIDFKSYEGKVFGKENGDWYVINPQRKKEVLHQNLFVQLNTYKTLLLKLLKGMREKYFPYIKHIQLNFIRCWGYFESGSSYDNKQLERENRITFDVITRDNLLEKLRFLDCGFSFSKQSIENIIDKLNVRKCKGLTDDGENEVLLKVKESFQRDEEEIFNNLLNWSNETLNNEKLRIISFTTRKEVEYYPLEASITEKLSEKDFSGSTREKEDLINLLEKEEKDYHLFLGIPGSGKTSVLKKFYLLKLKNFLADSKNKFPVLIHLHEIESGKTIEEYLAQSYPEIKEEIYYCIENGHSIFLLDAWDELIPSVKIDIETFSSSIVKKKNKLIISSRYISQGDYPKIKKENEKFYESYNLDVLPIDIKKIDNYFLSRNSELTNVYIQQLKELIKKSQIETIPLWMDLIVDFSLVYEDTKVDEIMLLAHWVERATKQNKHIEKIRDSVEEIAFQSFFDDTFSITKQSSKEFINSLYFDELKKLGWLVPAGFFKGEMKYDFVHKRLHEYLCACYIRSNWDVLIEDLFDRENGLLSRKKSEEIFYLTLLESKRLGIKTNIIEEMIYQIAGEDNWFLDGKVNYNLLLDPIFALILAKQIELDNTFYLEKLKEIAEHVWLNYNNTSLSETKKKLLTLLDKNQVKKAIYLIDLPLAMKTIPSSNWLGELEKYNIVSDKIELLMEELSKSLIINIDFTNTFFYLLRYGYSNRSKWTAEIKDFIAYIEKNPHLLQEKNHKIEDSKTKREFDWKLITKNAFDILLETEKEDVYEIIESWIYSGIKELELFIVLEFTAEQLSQLTKIENFYRKWLLNEKEQTRYLIINKIFWTSQYSDYNPDKILSEMETILSDQSYEDWFNYVELIEYKEKDNYQIPRMWLNQERESLLSWLCKTKSLSEVIQKLPVHKCNGLLTKIISLHIGPENADEAIMISNFLLDDFPFEDEIELLKDFFISKKVNEEFEKYLEIRRIQQKINRDEDVSSIVQFITHENEDVRFDAMYKCISNKSKEAIDYVNRLLKSEEKEHELIKEDLWEIIQNSPFDIVENYLELGLTKAKDIVKKLLISKLYYEGEKYQYNKNMNKLVLSLLKHKDRDIRIGASELISFFPELEKKSAIYELINHFEKDLQATALRIYSVSAGLNLDRIIIKTLNSVNYGTVRPLFSGNNISFTASYGIPFGEGFIHLERDETTKETRQKTERVNFGIRGLYVSEYIKKHFNTKIISGLYVRPLPYSFDEKKVQWIIDYYINPIIKTKNLLKEEEICFYKRVLQEKKYTHLLLTSLFHIEEILHTKPNFFKLLESNFLEILNTDYNEQIINIAQYLIFRYSDKTKLQRFYATFKDRGILNRQSFWWGIGLREERDYQSILVNDLENWKNEETFGIITLILPFITYSSKIFIEIYKKLLSSENSIYFEKLFRYIFKSPIDNRLLFLDWTFVRSLGCGKGDFQPSFGYDYVKGIDLLNNSIPNDLTFSVDDVLDLLNQMNKHSSLYFRELSDEISLETGRKEISDYENMLCSDSDIYILFFLFRHFNALTKDTKIKLIEILLKKTADKKEFQILENSVTKKAIGKIKISSNDRRVFLSVLREVHDMGILTLLKDIFKENREKDRLPYFLDIKEVAQEIWRKHSKLFIEEDINAVFNWLISLSNLDSRSKPSLYGISRDLLFKLLESIDPKNEKHTKLYNQIFFTLHDKPYYSFLDYWSYLFDNT